MVDLFSKHKKNIEALCKKLRVKRLYAFGSALSDRFDSKSDFDFLFSFYDDLSVEEYTENYFAFHSELENLLGRDVDLTSEHTLSNPYLIESINRNKALLYED